jgi:hypothetical protein
VILLPWAVYRITHSLTHTHSHSRCTILITLHRQSVALDPNSRLGDHVTVCSQPLLMPTHAEWNVCVSVYEYTHVLTLKVYCSWMLQWMLNLMELCKSCCYAINVSVLGWSDNGLHECSVTKLSKLPSDGLFHGGATLAVFIDSQKALPRFPNFIITLS